MKTNKIIFWVATGLISLMMLGSAGMYFTGGAHPEFARLGFPTWIIYPLAVAKILGIVAITTRKSAKLKEWAYAGFAFDFLLAAGAHIAVGDPVGGTAPSIVALLLLMTSYYFGDKMAEEG